MVDVKLATKAAYDLPEFVRDDYATFTAFIDAYHTWLNINQANIKTISDVDTTLESFITNFRAEVDYLGIAFPNIDERFLLRHIKKLYLSKGTEESYRTLFKLLFNKDAIIKYPYHLTLKPSDGKWEQIVSIFVEVVNGSADSVKNKVIKITNLTTTREVEVSINDTKRRRSGGGVSTIILTSGGTGYTTPTITLQGGNGQGATAHAVVDAGVITSIIVDTPGDNYVTPPNVIITGNNTTPAVITSVQMLMMPDIYEFNIEKNYYGSISVNDVIYHGDFEGKILPTINSFEILDQGRDFRLGQTFDIDTVFGRGATVKVTKLSTANKGLTELKFIKYGYGYVSDFESSNVIPPNVSQSTPYQGFSASIFTHVGNFAPSTLYKVNHVVWSTSSYYRCILEYTTGGTPTTPDSDPTHWTIYTGTEESRIGTFHEFAVADPSGGYILKETLSTTPDYDFIWAASVVKNTQSLTWANSKATVTTTTNHGLASGDTVVIAGVTPSTYNGSRLVTVTGLTTFTYALNTANPGTATVQGTVTTAYATNKVIKHINNFYRATTTGIQGATPPTHTSGTITHDGVSYLFLDSSDLYALNYAGETLREFYSSNKYNGDPANAARIKFNMGAVCKYPGHFINSDGMASDDIKLQDSFLYQKYSCVVQADEKLDKYRDIVKSFIHPAGVALFGEYNISNDFSVKLKLEALLSIFSIRHADAITAGHDELLGMWFEKMLEVNDDSYLLYGTQRDWTNILDNDNDWKRDTTKIIQDDPEDFTTVRNINDEDNVFHFTGAYSEILDDTTHPELLTNEVDTVVNDQTYAIRGGIIDHTDIADLISDWVRDVTKVVEDPIDTTIIADPEINWVRDVTKVAEDAIVAQNINDEDNVFHFTGAYSEILDDTTHPELLTNEVSTVIADPLDVTVIVDPEINWIRDVTKVVEDPIDTTIIVDPEINWVRDVTTVTADSITAINNDTDNVLDVSAIQSDESVATESIKSNMEYILGDLASINIDDIAGYDYITIEKDAVLLLFEDAYVQDRDINSTVVFSINSVKPITDESNPVIDAGSVTLNEYVTLLTDYVESFYVSAPNQIF